MARLVMLCVKCAASCSEKFTAAHEYATQVGQCECCLKKNVVTFPRIASTDGLHVISAQRK